MHNAVRRRSAHVCKRCAFTGYRPQKLPFGFNESDPACVALKAELYREIEDLIGQGYAHFLSGGAMATDTWAAEAVLDLKTKYLWIMQHLRNVLRKAAIIGIGVAVKQSSCCVAQFITRQFAL